MAAHRERAKQLQAFQEFCALGPGRSVRKMAERWRKDGGENTPSEAIAEKWSAWFDWQERATQYDQKLAAAELEAQAKAEVADRARRRTARLSDADLVRDVARTTLAASSGEHCRISPKRSGDLDDNEITPRMFEVAAVALARAGTEERLDTGEPTTRTALTADDKPFIIRLMIDNANQNG